MGDNRVKLNAMELMELCLPKLLAETSKHRIPVVFSIGRSYPGKVELLYNFYKSVQSNVDLKSELKAKIFRAQVNVLGTFFEYAEPGNWDLFQLLPNIEKNGIDLRKEGFIPCNIKLKTKNHET